MQYGVQLYTLRSLPPDDRLDIVTSTGVDGVELVGLDPVDAGDLSVVAAHVPVADIKADPAVALDRCRANGTETLVVPSLDETAFASDRVAETAARLDDLAADVTDLGGRLLYHNHEFEFAGGNGSTGSRDGDGAGDDDGSGGHGRTDDGDDASSDREAAGIDGTPYGRLVDATTHLGFELDVGWATAAGVDPVALIERLGDRLPVVHLKDVQVDPAAPRGGHPVDLGAGDVDLRGCRRAAERAGVEWLVFEHDAPADPEKSVRDAVAWLRNEPSGSR
ncbi:sugar phosphate isomerase/epimerase family protein [Salinigranum salinum]|uniref:sugar phosphate isomerase/epimerase family protein n=1 Tax=Salinigranum salinum TaxID=1364937 RepID=UPI00126133BB|nr:sugar phosphate isomerase/epimerase [Salinigranum salinum]